MKNSMTNIFLIGILILNIYSLVAGVVANAEPTVIDITFYPEEPAPLSTITFNATVDGDDISAVYLIVEECAGLICYKVQNVTMNEVGNGTYQAEATLKRDDATMVKYHLKIESNGAWYENERVEFDLSEKTNGQNSKKTPGFELIILIMSIIAVTFYIKKREK